MAEKEFALLKRLEMTNDSIESPLIKVLECSSMAERRERTISGVEVDGPMG